MDLGMLTMNLLVQVKRGEWGRGWMADQCQAEGAADPLVVRICNNTTNRTRQATAKLFSQRDERDLRTEVR